MPIQNFGVVAELSLGRISFFNPATLRVIQQVTLGYDFIEQAITSDCTRIVSVSGFAARLVEFNTCAPTAIDAVQQAPTILRDVDIIPDNRFAVVSGGTSIPVLKFCIRS